MRFINLSRKLHFSLYCFLLGDFIFFSSRTMLHSKTTDENIVLKCCTFTWFGLLIMDTYWVIFSHRRLQKMSDEQKNKISAKI